MKQEFWASAGTRRKAWGWCTFWGVFTVLALLLTSGLPGWLWVLLGLSGCFLEGGRARMFSRIPLLQVSSGELFLARWRGVPQRLLVEQILQAGVRPIRRGAFLTLVHRENGRSRVWMQDLWSFEEPYAVCFVLLKHLPPSCQRDKLRPETWEARSEGPPAITLN